MDFSLLRLLLACSVLLAHFSRVTGEPGEFSYGVSSTVSVQAFFVVSGWIVTASFETSHSVLAFFVRRLSRLYPLYFAVVILQTAMITILCRTPESRWSEVLNYLAANLLFASFLKPTFFGFLNNAPVMAVNPSLWTMKIEVMFYLCVPALVYCFRRFSMSGLLFLFFASVFFAWAVGPVSGQLANQLPGQLRFFVIGMLLRKMLFSNGACKVPHWLPTLIVGVLAFFMTRELEDLNVGLLLQPLAVGGFVFAAGSLLPRIQGFPDISFGVYLLHAPLMQFGREFGYLSASLSSLISVFLVTILAAFLAHYLIELPGIRFGHWFSNNRANRLKINAGT